MSIVIREVDASLDDAVAAFLDELGSSNNSVSAYYYPFFRAMLAQIGLGHPIYLGAFDAHDTLVGVLPAFSRSTVAGTVTSSLPFCGTAGVLCRKDHNECDIHSGLIEALLKRAGGADHALSCSIYTPFLFDSFGLYDTAMPNAQVVERFTQFQDIQSGVLNSNRQYDIRKAIRAGVTVSTERTVANVEAFFHMYEQNCRDLGILLKPRSCVEYLAYHPDATRHVRMYFAFHRGRMIGGLLVLVAGSTVTYYIPCSESSARNLEPGVLLIARAMEDLRTCGIRYWNWEGSPSRDSGVYHFKRKWGGEERPYRIYVDSFVAPTVFQEMGVGAIRESFPSYFVYPFQSWAGGRD